MHRVAAEMPDDGGRAETDRVTGILKPPAYVDIVAGRAVDRIEAAERHQYIAAERHVATGDVLGDLIADQHMGGSAGRHRDGGGNQAVLGRREIRPAAGREIAGLHLGDEVGQPVWIGNAVAVGVGDDFAGCRLGPDIARDAQPFVRLADDPAEREPFGDLEGAVGRPVIDDDDLVIGIIENFERGETGLHRALGIIGADHHRNPRVARQRRRQRSLVAPGDRVEGRFRLALGVD